MVFSCIIQENTLFEHDCLGSPEGVGIDNALDGASLQAGLTDGCSKITVPLSGELWDDF